MDNSADEKLIRQLFDNLSKAWNSGNGELYASYFTDDCDYITFSGEYIEGRQAIAKTHQLLFDNFVMRGSKLVGNGIYKIAFLTADIVIVHAKGTVQLRFQKKAPQGRLSINTNIVIRQNEQWKIRAFHNCRVKKPGLFQKLFVGKLSKQNNGSLKN